jgi:hypothetical protein
MDTTTLFRSVTPTELRLIAKSGFKRFPAPDQPLFYPLCNEEYAIEIVQRWNAREDMGGFVTRFVVRSEALRPYEKHIVGPRHHEEYWIPCTDLDDLNDAIVGLIEVVREFPPSSVIEARKRWFENYVEGAAETSVVAGAEGGPYRCPCCGYRTLNERGAFEICPVCFWEDDGQDEGDVDTVRGGPNGSLSLRAARHNFERIGASDERSLTSVRAPKEEEE